MERVAVFTGPTNKNVKKEIIKAWRADRLDLVIATSAFGLGVDWYAWQQLDLFGYVNWSNDQFARWPTLLFAIDTRANVGFRYYEMGSIYEYLWVRQLYLQMREFEIER